MNDLNVKVYSSHSGISSIIFQRNLNNQLTTIKQSAERKQQLQRAMRSVSNGNGKREQNSNKSFIFPSANDPLESQSYSFHYPSSSSSTEARNHIGQTKKKKVLSTLIPLSSKEHIIPQFSMNNQNAYSPMYSDTSSYIFGSEANKRIQSRRQSQPLQQLQSPINYYNFSNEIKNEFFADTRSISSSPKRRVIKLNDTLQISINFDQQLQVFSTKKSQNESHFIHSNFTPLRRNVRRVREECKLNLDNQDNSFGSFSYQNKAEKLESLYQNSPNQRQKSKESSVLDTESTETIKYEKKIDATNSEQLSHYLQQSKQFKRYNKQSERISLGHILNPINPISKKIEQSQQQQQQEQNLQSKPKIQTSPCKLNDEDSSSPSSRGAKFKFNSKRQTIVSIIKGNYLQNNPGLQSSEFKISSVESSSFLTKWKEVKKPLKGKNVLDLFGEDYFSQDQRLEIGNAPEVYFLGKLQNESQQQQNPNQSLQSEQQPSEQASLNQEQENKEYQIIIGDHINFRYEIIKKLGKGSFGQVVKVLDHKLKEYFALKIIGGSKKMIEQSKIEIQILQFIRSKDLNSCLNISKLIDSFAFRDYNFIVIELLSHNLYDLLKVNNYQGLSSDLVRRFAIQILNALHFLRKNLIIHCDLKPENILLKQSNKSGIKLIDFGSSCFIDQKLYTYIQSRYYRAPEIMLQLPYNYSIDMWSFACIICELLTGEPIFPGKDEYHQIAFIIELIGVPPSNYLQNCKRRKLFFNDDLSPKMAGDPTRKPASKTLRALLGIDSENLLDFISKCFVWNPEERMKPCDALAHEWILEGLPAEIRDQHLQYIKGQLIKHNETKEKNIKEKQ